MKKLFQIITTLMASSLFPFFVQAQTSINPINQNFTPEALALLGTDVPQPVINTTEYNSGDYRAVQSGSWKSISTWEVYDATKNSWHSAELIPKMSLQSVVHIPDGITITANRHISCYHLITHGSGNFTVKHGGLKRIKSDSKYL